MWTFSPVIPLLHSKEVKKGTHEWLHGHLGHGHRQSTDLLRGSTEGCRKDGNPQVISAGSCKKPHAAVVRDEAVQQIIEEEHPGAHQTTLGCRRCRAAVRCWEHGVLCAAAAVCIFWSSHESISDCKKKKKNDIYFVHGVFRNQKGGLNLFSLLNSPWCTELWFYFWTFFPLFCLQDIQQGIKSSLPEAEVQAGDYF